MGHVIKILRAFIMLITIVAASSGVAFLAYSVAGRVIGLSVTTLCGAFMAFFCMPPFFSFRVSQMHDVLALAAYGVVGLVLAGTAPSKRRAAGNPAIQQYDLCIPERVEVDIESTIAELLSSALGDRLRGIEVVVLQNVIALNHSRSDTKRILFDVLREASLLPKVQRISISVGHRPGLRQLNVVARHNIEDLHGKVITIGKRDEDCERIEFPGWPQASHATYFDNGCERVFQISVKDDE